MKDDHRQTRQSMPELLEEKGAETIERRRHSMHDNGSLTEQLTNEDWNKKVKKTNVQLHRTRLSRDLCDLNIGLDSLAETPYNFNPKNAIPSPTGLRHRYSASIEIAQPPTDVLPPNSVEVSSQLDSDDSELKLVMNDANAEGYESDASNTTAVSVRSNWDKYYDKKRPWDIWLEKGDVHLSETPSLTSDWEEAGFLTDVSESENKCAAFRGLRTRTSTGSSEILEAITNGILVVFKKNKHTTRARLISDEMTLASLASWLRNEKPVDSLAQQGKIYFSYNFKRYTSSKLEVSIKELFSDPLDSLSHGLLIFYGPINGKLTYKIMLHGLKDLQRLCINDGIDFKTMLKENMTRRETFEEIKLDQPLPRKDTTDELKLEPQKHDKLRTDDLLSITFGSKHT